MNNNLAHKFILASFTSEMHRQTRQNYL